ncbi:DciA family protein [uncultured Paludibaculum sp.]|uniref:DciA family protein n=1 Tax=uncultured Paludibaculum sp. TaxID=1765020 RepID=UPI002AAB34BD|nr:DciA family protein [uncultured Paludibaculum sp.]
MERAGRIIAKLRTAQKHFTQEELTLAAWPAAVGKRLAGRTRAVALQGNNVVVLVEDDQWRRNLWGLRQQILRNLGDLLDGAAPHGIEFRVGVPRRPPQRAEAVSDFSLTSPTLRPADEADGIADPVLRRIYLNSRRKARAS